MNKLILCGKEFRCYREDKISSYDDNYYTIDNDGHLCCEELFLHQHNIMIREVYNEAYNTITLTIGYYNYAEERFFPLIELSEMYNENIVFGTIGWQKD